MPSFTVRYLLALLVAVAVFLPPLSAQRASLAGEPLMVMVQISDSQAITAADQARFEFVLATVVAAASAAQENVILVGHHRHNERGRTPLESALESADVVGYVRGHLDQPHVVAGLSGIANPNVFDLNSNSILDVGAILYYEVFADRIEAYALRVAFGETELSSPEVI